MCDAKSAIGLQVAGSLQKATGAYFSASSERANLGVTADIADTNARLSDIAAQSTLDQGRLEEQRSRIDTQNTIDRQKTGFAGNNIALDSETAIRVAASTEVLGEIDANTINSNAARAAFGHTVEATQSRNEALGARAGQKNYSPVTSLTNSLINSSGSISSNFLRLKRAGAFE